MGPKKGLYGLVVQAGDKVLGSLSEADQSGYVTEIFIHPQWIEDDYKVVDGDIALLQVLVMQIHK